MKAKNPSTPHDALVLALEGDRPLSYKLSLGEIQSGNVPPLYFASISAQNGNPGLELARILYWSGNSFNQIRALYWCKNQDTDTVGEVLWGGIVVDKNDIILSTQKNQWKEIYKNEYQNNILKVEIKQIGRTKIEKNILLLHANKALLGSISDAKELWNFYQHQYKVEDGIASYLGFDWIQLAMIEIQGFPGPRSIDRYLYWLQIAAENGDQKAQGILSHEMNVNDDNSRIRKSYWLRRASGH